MAGWKTEFIGRGNPGIVKFDFGGGSIAFDEIFQQQIQAHIKNISDYAGPEKYFAQLWFQE